MILQDNEEEVLFTDVKIEGRFHMKDYFGEAHFFKTDYMMGKCIRSEHPKYLWEYNFKFYPKQKVLIFKK
jgi:hypothetical protein